jgi:predicted O-methyltransferase YrrM
MLTSVMSWTGADSFELGGIRYTCRPLEGRFPSEPGHFCLVKPRFDVEWYTQFLRDLAPRTIVEVGTYDGASAAFFAEIARPKKLVTLDRRRKTSEAFTDFVTRRGFESTISAYGGVDQSDVRRLNEIMAAEFQGERLDLVVDDASHLVEPTRSTFNCLYPRLRPGGIYVIEDWPTHIAQLDEVSLAAFVFELMLAAANQPTAISELTANWNFVLVERPDSDIDPDSFNVSSCYGPRARSLVTKLIG